MEREAYAARQAYLIRYRVYQPIGSSMHFTQCVLAADKSCLTHHASARSQ